eukprot:scaffold137090_cov48-Prasinocladus_malaysianus.AAC.1
MIEFCGALLNCASVDRAKRRPAKILLPYANFALAWLCGKGSADDRYSEWVGVQQRVAVLCAHARCAVHVADYSYESEYGCVSSDTDPADPDSAGTVTAIRAAQAPLLGQLQGLWLNLLQ